MRSSVLRTAGLRCSAVRQAGVGLHGSRKAASNAEIKPTHPAEFTLVETSPVGSSAVEDDEVQLTQPLGIADHVDFDDLSALDLEGECDTRPAARRP